MRLAALLAVVFLAVVFLAVTFLARPLLAGARLLAVSAAFRTCRAGADAAVLNWSAISSRRASRRDRSS